MGIGAGLGVVMRGAGPLGEAVRPRTDNAAGREMFPKRKPRG
jgi:hypothetical protein